MTERCEITELLVDQCGCRHHRGGQAPQEEAHAHDLPPSDWFKARWPGFCETGQHVFREGERVRYDGGPIGSLECWGCGS